MNNKKKETVRYVLTFIFVFIVPHTILHYFKMDEDAIFRGRVKEDEEICYQRAKRDLVDTRWCGEIRDAATLAYNQSSRGFDSSLLLLLYSPLLFVLIITIQNLKDQLKELKEKIDV